MSRPWLTGEVAQAEYEQLRRIALAGGSSLTQSARQFEHHGLAGLILSPRHELPFTVRVEGAVRPAWTPHDDPRLQRLAGAYELLLGVAAAMPVARTVTR